MLVQTPLQAQAITAQMLFKQLLVQRDRTADFTGLGPWLQQHITHCTFPDPGHFPWQAAAYTRNRIAQENCCPHPGFEALLIRWDRQAQTHIHGHPAFSFYHVISGVFEMELFTQTAMGLKQTGNQRFTPSQTTWFVGQTDRYDNFIHRVTCLEPGLTFHVYSDDAQKGMAL
ncbi:MAG: hypothetical protein F6J87_06395 [Spirulina sp. SIO3F2]|nr:hypothetical protein [Spirulina sp. SIO3F2]